MDYGKDLINIKPQLCAALNSFLTLTLGNPVYMLCRNIMSNQAACDYVRKILIQHEPTPNLSAEAEQEEEQELLDSIANRLTQHALDKKSNDNITVVLVIFTAAKTIKHRAAENQREIENSTRHSISAQNLPGSTFGLNTTREKVLFTSASITESDNENTQSNEEKSELNK
jgi:hypothetical protein